MTTPNGSNFRFTDIENEFGQTADRKFGDYVGTWTYGDYDSPLDRGPYGGTSTPTVKQNVRFANFRNRKLNVIVDFYNGATQVRQDAYTRYTGIVPNTSPIQNGAKVVGPAGSTSAGGNGSVTPPSNGGGKRVTIQVNQLIGSASVDPNNSDTQNRVALRTGVAWATGTDLHLNVGEDGWITGAGGKGGNGGSAGAGGAGLSGTAALGIEWENTEITVNEEGRVRTGFGGGGGGGGAECSHELGPFSSPERKASGGGGGGGAGYPAGAKGSKGTAGNDGIDGTAGTQFTHGIGGDGGYDGSGEAWAEGGKGGNGGSSGNAAQTGNNGAVGGGEREGSGSARAGGGPGGSGGAIRKSEATINWTFGTGHVTNNVAGDGRGGDTESPTGIS